MEKSNKEIENQNEQSIRLNKRIALSGLASRRKAEDYITAGKVKVNGKIVRDLSYKVSPRDILEVDGKLLLPKSFKYLLFNKPVGYITTLSDEKGRKTIYDLIPSEYRHLKPVGRLDKDSEGLLILTNHGDFINKILHPKYKVSKKYLVRISGLTSNEKTEELIKKLKSGVFLDDRCFKVDSVLNVYESYLYKRKQWNFEIVIHEGVNRLIRRIFQNLGYSVSRLKRIQVGKLNLNSLEKNKKLYEEITEYEAGQIFK